MPRNAIVEKTHRTIEPSCLKNIPPPDHRNKSFIKVNARKHVKVNTSYFLSKLVL